MTEWNPAWEAAVKENDLKVVDVSLGLSKVWEAKDANEQAFLSVSSKGSDKFMDLLSNEMVRAVDEELKITNAKLSDKIENKIDDVKFLKQLSPDLSALCPSSHKFNFDLLDWTYSPIIQSGKKFDLRVRHVQPMTNYTVTVVFWPRVESVIIITVQTLLELS